jgi:hypothetical protein
MIFLGFTLIVVASGNKIVWYMGIFCLTIGILEWLDKGK